MHDGLGSWLATRRLKTPDRAALIHGDGRTLTYRDVADAADSIAGLLWRRGIRPGDRVAYLGENSPEFVEVLFATVQLGAVFVPLNTRLAPPEIAHLLVDSGAGILIHDPECAERLPRVEGDDLPRLPEFIPTGHGQEDRRGLADLVDPAVPFERPGQSGSADPAAIIYTSGTTGRAKGAILTHQNLTSAAINSIVDYDIVSTDVALMISPLFHVASLGMGLLPLIMKGATIVLQRGFSAGLALESIERYGVTMLSGVPTTFQLLAEHADWQTTELSTLAKLTCGGSAVPSHTLEAYEERGLSFSQGYGMTETSPGVTALAATMTRAKKGSVGLPHFFTAIRITDEHGTPVPPGAVGQIEISGPNVFAGYFGQPEATATAFTSDGWFRSGDLGHVDSDGYLYISGRLKDMIISGGENIYPAEVENLIMDIDGVTGVAVFGVDDERWGEVPWAALTVGPGRSIDTAGVRAHLDGRLARYKLPQRVVIVEELPRTASGKVLKAELRARLTDPPR